jgi:hypothetical protein
MIREIERNALRLAGNAGVAWSTGETPHERACRQFPGQRVLAPAGAEKQDIHRVTRMIWWSDSNIRIPVRQAFARMLESKDHYHLWELGSFWI